MLREKLIETKIEARDRWWRYLYYNMDWKHATAMKKMRLKDGQATKESDDFVKIVNYVNRDNVRWVKL